MEFPSSAQFKVTHESSYNAAKAFLDNERGDTNENVEVKDIISEQSDKEEKKNSSDNDGTLKNSNLNSNTTVQHDLKGNVQSDSGVNSDFQKDILNEQEKFKQSTPSIEASSIEDEKFKDTKSNKEILDKGFKTSETIIDNKNLDGSTIEKEETGEHLKNNEVKDTKQSIVKESDPEPENSSENKGKESEKEEWMDILGSGQLKKKTLKPGIPDSRPQKADVCVISITGKLENGKIFEPQKCLEINLGDNETVQGLDFALALMDKGEEAEVIVASRFGYGSLGYKPDVPPDATLHYHITLLDVKQEPLINTLNIKERIAIGCRKKERGNWWYTREEHTLAIHSYRRALDYLDDTDIPGEHTDEDVNQLLEERLKTYNNLGASQMKINSYDAALISIDQVLNCQPKNVKALFRKSKILKEKGELSKSIEVIREALAVEPDTKSLQQELSLLLAAQRKDNSKQRDLYKKMMGNSSQENESDKKKKTSSNAFKWVAAFSFAVAVIGAVAFKYRL